MYKVVYYFIVQGDWECGQYRHYTILNWLPEKGDIISHERLMYEVVDVKKDGPYYQVYLD